MESLADDAKACLKASLMPVEDKLRHLTALKQEIKHRSCPERAIPTIFEVVRLALATPHVFDAGFSILGHLNRRLLLQKLEATIHSHTVRLFPVLHDRLGDPRDRIRERAIAALSDLHTVSDDASSDVEQFIRDTALTSKHPRAKISAMQWIVESHKEKDMRFRAFVPHIVNCLEDADGHVRKTAQETVIELFTDTPAKSKSDLQKKMRERNVRKGIENHILSELGLEAKARDATRAEHHTQPVSPPTRTPRVEFAHSTNPDQRAAVSPGARQRRLPPSKLSQTTNALPDEAPPAEAQPMSVAQQEAASLSPLYIESARDLEETLRDMHQWFEGKEAESNWLKREKSIEKLRRLVKGNAPQDYTTSFIASIKSMLDGILKAVNSLRTTLCTIGCHLLQDLAHVCGSGLDSMVEILLQNLVKLCGNTKKIAANKANDTVAALVAHVSYHTRLLQHIHMATQDKNAQPRTFASGWLKTILTRHGNAKSGIEHSGGVELIEKSIKNGLNDSNPAVRENMRPVYWLFASLWVEKSEAIMSGLSQSHQDLLVKNAANPNPQQTTSTAVAAGQKSTLSKSVGPASTRPSIKETIAAQKKAKAARKDLPERPGSAAETSKSPVKPTGPARPATSMSTTRQPSTQSTGTLSSAPVRPRRLPHMAKATATENTSGTLKDEIRSRPEPTFEELGLRLPSTEYDYFAGERWSNDPKRHHVTVKELKALVPESIFDRPPPIGKDDPFYLACKNWESPPDSREPSASKPATDATADANAGVSDAQEGDGKLETDEQPVYNEKSPPGTESSTDPGMKRDTSEATQPSAAISEEQSIQEEAHRESSDMSDKTQIHWPEKRSPQRETQRSVSKKSAHTPSSSSKSVSPQRDTSITALPFIQSNEEVESAKKQSPQRSPKRAERISMSPRSIVSRKENLQPKPQAQRPLQVYEDPVSNGSTVASPMSDDCRRLRALGELPINEPTNRVRAADEDFKLNREEYQHGVPEHYNIEWKMIQKRQLSKVKHESEKMENPMQAQKILRSAIVRIQAHSLDIHGFRKLQSVIYFAPRAIWEDGYKAQEIMVPLLDQLETENDAEDILDVNKEIDLKTQILVTIRMLYHEFEHELSSLHVQILCSLIAARRFYPDTSHMVSGLQDTSEILADRVHPAEGVNAVIDLMVTEVDPRLRTMGCYVLAGLLHRIHLQGIAPGMLNYEGLERVFRNAMDHYHPDVRRAGIEFGLELEHNVAEERFVKIMVDLKNGTKGLFAYYQARHKLVHQV